MCNMRQFLNNLHTQLIYITLQPWQCSYSRFANVLFAINAFSRFANVLGQFPNFFRLISLGLKEQRTM